MTRDCQLDAPRRPSVVAWAAFYNLVHVAGLGFCGVVFISDLEVLPLAVIPIALMAPFAILMLGLRRGVAWAWVGQLVMICLTLGLCSIPGLIWLPLLIAWCSTPVRDWFDPPMQRSFG